MPSQEFLVDILVKSTLLLIAAALVDWMLYWTSAAARHLLWAATFLALLFLPLVSGTAPPLRLAIAPLNWGSPSEPAETRNAKQSGIIDTTTNRPGIPADGPESPPSDILEGESAALLDSGIPAASPPVFSNATAHEPRASKSGRSFRAFQPSIRLWAVWAAGFALALSPLVWGFASTVVLKRRSIWITDNDSVSLLVDLGVTLGIRRHIELMETPRAMVPMACGVVRPTVLVPWAWRTWTAERRRLVLLHELSHVKRMDVIHQTIARLACSLFWFHLLAWYALRRLRIERELACDDCVLMSGALPSSYASELLTVACECQAMALSPAVAMAQPSGLEKRIRALFDKTRSHLPVSYRRKPVVMLGILAAVTLLAVVRLDAVAEPPTAATSDRAASDDHSDDPLLAAEAIARLGTVDLRNNGGVSALAFSPDGKQLVSGGQYHSLRFWDVKTGRQAKQIRAGGAGRSIVFSPDGTKLAYTGDKDVRLLDLETGEELFASAQLPQSISSVVFAPDGLAFATAGGDEPVRLWDVATGAELVKLHSATHPVAFSPDGARLATGSKDREIQVWNMHSGDMVQFSDEQDLRRLASQAFTPDGQHVVSAGERIEREEGGHVVRSSLSVWRVADGKKIGELDSEDVSTLGSCLMVMTPDGETVVTGHHEQIVVWDLASRKPRRIIDLVEPYVDKLAVSSDGRLIAAAIGSSRHKTYLWDAVTGEELFPQSDSHHGTVLTIDTSPDQSLIVTGGEEGAVHLWDAKTYKHIRRLTRTGSWIRLVQFFPDGQRVLAVGERSGPEVEGIQGLALILRVADGDVLRRLELPDRGMQAALSADGDTLAVAMGMGGYLGGGKPPQVGIWNLASKNEPLMFPAEGEMKHLSFDTDAGHLFGINARGEIRRWGVDSGELTETVQIETEPRLGASPVLSLTGQFAMYGGLESGSRKPGDRRGHLVMADMQTGKRVWSQETADGWPKSLAVSLDGKYYAAWYAIGRRTANPIIIGRASDGKELARFYLSDDMVGSLAFSRDGTKLFSGMDRGDVLVWEVPRL